VPSLIAKSPLAGQAPVTHGSITLSEEPLVRMTSAAPFRGAEKALKALGFAMPPPNTCTADKDHLILWTGRNQAFLIGPVPEGLTGVAAITDQSDGWARLRLEGTGVADVLMRLIPLDLRRFGPGHAARAPLGHMQCILISAKDNQIDVLVFRSMARTAWTEISEAMQTVAARAGAAR
jgi:heterotetrameric sarcosine oxidase gamma subunit